MTEQVEQTQTAETVEATQPPPVTLGLQDLQTMLTVIDTVTQRGAFKANELAAVGILYNRIQTFLDAAKAAQEAQQQPATPEATA